MITACRTIIGDTNTNVRKSCSDMFLLHIHPPIHSVWITKVDGRLEAARPPLWRRPSAAIMGGGEVRIYSTRIGKYVLLYFIFA